jgi:hypothetical protein
MKYIVTTKQIATEKTCNGWKSHYQQTCW